jgi:hypothetical protein
MLPLCSYPIIVLHYIENEILIAAFVIKNKLNECRIQLLLFLSLLNSSLSFNLSTPWHHVPCITALNQLIILYSFLLFVFHICTCVSMYPQIFSTLHFFKGVSFIFYPDHLCGSALGLHTKHDSFKVGIFARLCGWL